MANLLGRNLGHILSRKFGPKSTLSWADGKWASTTQIRTSCMTGRLKRAGFDDGILIENQWNFHRIIVLL